MRRLAPALVCLAAAVTLVAPLAAGEALIGLTTTNALVRFDSATPGTLQSTVAVTGLTAGDALVAIDVRPSTGLLYGLGLNGTTAHVYTIDATTAAATRLGGNISLPQSPGVVGAETAFGFDFNPTADRIRVVAANGDNFRLNPTTGGVAGADTALTTGAVVVGAAYDRNTVGASKATLYAIDSTTDQLVRIGGVDGIPSANSGVVTTVGPLGAATTSNVGFDISPTGTAFASLSSASASSLYTINLGSGAATLVGSIGSSPTLLLDVAVAITPGIPSTPLVALTPTNSLLRFDAANPGVIQSTVPLTGIAGGDSVVAIDVRPLTGLVYGLGLNGSTAHLYAINGVTGASVQIGGDITLPQSPGTAGAGTAYGIDFQPVVDRIRVVSNTRDNFRLAPTTGVVAGPDTAINPGTPNIVAVAYDRNFVGSTTTTLYGIDSATDQLVLIGSVDGTPTNPNAGTITTVGAGLGVDTSDDAGFDIAPSGVAFASLTVGGISRLYLVNLATGGASLIGPIGAGLVVRDVAAEINSGGGPCNPDATAPALSGPPATTITQTLCM